jgi:hypothetical protein
VTLQTALEQAELLSREWEEIGRLFVQKGLEFQEALAQISALLAIEKAKEEHGPSR